MSYQFEPPIVPKSWTAEEKRYAQGVLDVLEQVYLRYGRIGLNLLSAGLRNTIQGKVDGSEYETQINQLLGAIELRATKTYVDDADDALDSRLQTAELKLTPEEILLAIADGTSSKVQLSAIKALIESDDVEIRTLALSIIMRNMAGEEIAVFDGDGLSMEKPISTPLVLSPSVLGVYLGPQVVPWQGSIQATINSLPKYLYRGVTINIPEGTYVENVLVDNFYGARMLIKGAPKIIGKIDVIACGARVVIEGIDANNPMEILAADGSNNIITAQNNSTLTVSFVRATGHVRSSTADSTSVGINFIASRGCVSECIVERCTEAIRAIETSQIEVYNCRGGVSGGNYTTLANLEYGVGAYRGSLIGINGTIPIGGNANTTTWFSQIVGTGTATASPGAAPPPPTTRVLTYDASESGYWLKDSNDRWDKKSGTNVWQADGATYGKRLGFWCVQNANQIASQIGSGTVQKVEVILERHTSYGSSGSMGLRLRTHNYATISGYTGSGTITRPVMSSLLMEVGFEKGQQRVVTLPSSVHAGFKNGTIKGLGVLEGGASICMRPICTIKITVQGGP